MSINFVEPGPDELEVPNLRANISRGACFKKRLSNQPGAPFPVALEERNNAKLSLGFPELRERPPKRGITSDEFLRILRVAPLHLRVGITLLDQTGNRTYSEVFRLRWEQIDMEAGLIYLSGPLKTAASAVPTPLTKLASDVLRWWKDQQVGSGSPYVFPSPLNRDKPLGTVKTAWRNTLKRAGVPYFPIYQIRHAFCTRVSKVAPDAVIQKAMRHSSPETKRLYQLGMVEEVRKAMEHGNQKFYGDLEYHVFITVTSDKPQRTDEKCLQVTGT